MKTMNPCRKNRKLIAWLALGALEDQKERELCAHLEICAGCRRYLNETSHVAERLKEADNPAEISASESFHHRVLEDLSVEDKWWRTWATQGPVRLRWRVAAPILGATALVILGWTIFIRHHVTRLPAPPIAKSVSPPSDSRPAPLPTLFSYQMAANQSLDRFDQLLNTQAGRNPPPAPDDKASSLASANDLE